MFNLHFTYLELWTIYKLSFIIDNAVDPDPDPGFGLPKVGKFYSWQKLLFVLIKNSNFLFSHQKRTAGTSKHETSSIIFWSLLCSPGSGSGSGSSRQKSMRIPSGSGSRSAATTCTWSYVCRSMKVIRQEESVFDIVLSDKICWPDCEFFHYYTVFNGRRLPMYVGRGRSPSHAS